MSFVYIQSLVCRNNYELNLYYTLIENRYYINWIHPGLSKYTFFDQIPFSNGLYTIHNTARAKQKFKKMEMAHFRFLECL